MSSTHAAYWSQQFAAMHCSHALSSGTSGLHTSPVSVSVAPPVPLVSVSPAVSVRPVSLSDTVPSVSPVLSVVLVLVLSVALAAVTSVAVTVVDAVSPVECDSPTLPLPASLSLSDPLTVPVVGPVAVADADLEAEPAVVPVAGSVMPPELDALSSLALVAVTTAQQPQRQQRGMDPTPA